MLISQTRKYLIPISFAFIILLSCKKDKEVKNFDAFQNESYGPKARNKFDLFIPKNKGTSLPLVIFLHGGGWVGGDKEQVNYFLPHFLEKGIAVASILYSFADGENRSSEINSDVNQAVSFLKEKAHTYHFSSSKIGMMGYSAGGQLVLLHSYKSGGVKCVASISGIANLRDSFYTNPTNTIYPLVTQYIGVPYNSSSSDWQSNSPVNYAARFKVPTYLVSAQSDEIVNPLDSKKLHAVLDSISVPNVYKEYEGDHQLFFNFNESEWDDMADWFLTYLES